MNFLRKSCFLLLFCSLASAVEASAIASLKTFVRDTRTVPRSILADGPRQEHAGGTKRRRYDAIRTPGQVSMGV